MTAPMRPTTINERWTLILPEHRAARTEWPVWEKERLAAMHDLITGPRVGGPEIPVLPYPDVVYDIGAEEGDFPALWASWGAEVVMVEPNPRVWPNIRAIFEANELTGHVLGWHVGFAGEVAREASDEWEWQTTRGPHNGWPECAYGPVIGDHGFLVLPERPEVPVVTIDGLAVQFDPPTVITIDVEGAELTVLRGARQVLSVDRPAVFVSVHLDLPWVDEKYPGDTGDKVAEFMTGLGYEGRHLATDHEEHWEWRHPEGR